jgi:Sporulation and spore germination
VHARALLALLALVLTAGCGGGDARVTVYLAQRLGPEGPNSQIAPVLMPVEREPTAGMAAAWQAVLELRAGPAPDERAHGVLDTVDPSTRVRALRIERGTATVELAGVEPDLRSSAAIVYTLTELPGIARVRLRLAGRGCCVYRHDGSPVEALTREGFAGWTGEPCHLRTENRCRG